MPCFRPPAPPSPLIPIFLPDLIDHQAVRLARELAASSSSRREPRRGTEGGPRIARMGRRRRVSHKEHKDRKEEGEPGFGVARRAHGPGCGVNLRGFSIPPSIILPPSFCRRPQASPRPERRPLPMLPAALRPLRSALRHSPLSPGFRKIQRSDFALAHPCYPPPMCDPFASAPSRSPRPLAGSPAQASTDSRPTAPPPLHPAPRSNCACPSPLPVGQASRPAGSWGLRPQADLTGLRQIPASKDSCPLSFGPARRLHRRQATPSLQGKPRKTKPPTVLGAR